MSHDLDGACLQFIKFTDDLVVRYRYNKDIGLIAGVTLLREFYTGLDLMCIMANRIFRGPGSDILTIRGDVEKQVRLALRATEPEPIVDLGDDPHYTQRERAAYEKRVNARKTEYAYVSYHAKAIFATVMARIHRISKSRQQELGVLFDINSPYYLAGRGSTPNNQNSPFNQCRQLMLAAERDLFETPNASGTAIGVGGSNDLIRTVLNFYLCSTMLYEMEVQFIHLALSHTRKYGPFSRLEIIPVLLVLHKTHIFKTGLSDYITALGEKIFKVQFQSAFMDMILYVMSDYTRSFIEPRASSPTITYVKDTVQFPRGPFRAHGLLPRDSIKNAHSVCESVFGETLLTIRPFVLQHVMSTLAAARLGFSLPLMCEVFAVYGNNDGRYSVSAHYAPTKPQRFKDIYDTLKKQDIVNLFKLLARFEASNFVSHDMSHRSISAFMDSEIVDLRWYIDAYNFAWYGGTDYDPSAKVVPFVNVPYGWDPTLQRVELPNFLYAGGWPGASVSDQFEAPPRRYDMACFVASLFVEKDLFPTDFKQMVVDTFREVVDGEFFPLSLRFNKFLVYRENYGAPFITLMELKWINDMRLFVPLN